MIESFVEGRVRLRSPLFADASIADVIASGLARVEGVRKAEVNSRTNGLLLEYDKTRLPLSMLILARDIFVRMSEAESLPPAEIRAAVTSLVAELAAVLNAGTE
jgi:hypothetical protein